MSIKNKLNRLKSHLSIKESETQKVIKPEIEIPFLEQWQQEGVSPYYLDDQFCLIREIKYPLDFQHGSYSFREYEHAVEMWNNSKLNHPLSSKGYKANELFFFDTETTGLGGGTGNTIFILGHAHMSENEIVLTQHILPHPGAEVPLYHSFLKDVDYRTLVTYNGKSFDWPQVKTRHTLIREHVPKLPEFGHFDLYHASRRIWKHRLERMKLAIVEKEVLGVNRHDDVPGFLAPMIYFDFVERKDPEGMIKILKHNEIDILSLITLYTHLSFQILGVDKNQTFEEKYEIGRWFSSLGEIHTAKNVYQGIENDGDKVSVTTQLQLGYLFKKQKNYDQSYAYFQLVAHSDFPTIQIEACVEAAKILEHQKKEFAEAIVYCDLAIDLIKNGHTHSRLEISDIQKRKERNLRKNNFLGKRKLIENSSI
jgi:uncharacterized protein